MLKHFKSILKDQSGMSLVEVMVAVGISSVVSMGVMKINETATKGMNHTSTKFNLQEYQRSTLALTLSKPEHCKANFLGKNVSGVLAADQFVVGSKIVKADGTIIAGVDAPDNKTPEGDWTINSFQLDPIVRDGAGQTGICNLRMTLTRNKMAFGGTSQNIRIPLYCMVDAGDLITTCMAASAANSDIWQMNYRTGFEFINYLPASGLGYVVIGPDPSGNTPSFEVNASLTINQDGFDWRGFPPYKEGLKMPKMNVVTWEDWGISEGVSHTAGSANCFKMANFPTATTLNQQAEFCPTFLSTQSLNGTAYNNHIIANRGGIQLLPWDAAATNASTVRIESTDGAFTIDYNFLKRNLTSGALELARGNSSDGDNGAVVMTMTNTGHFYLASILNVDNLGAPLLHLDPNGIIESNNSYFSDKQNDFQVGLGIPSLVIGTSNKGGLSTDTAPSPHNTEGSIIVGSENIVRSKSSLVVGLSNDLPKTANFSTVVGTFNILGGATAGSFQNVFGELNLTNNSGYNLVVGNSNMVDGINSITLGSSNWLGGNYAQTIGMNNVASADHSMAIGRNNLAATVYSFAFGYDSESTGVSSFSFGNGAKASQGYTMAFGLLAEANKQGSIALGNNTMATSFNNSFVTGTFNNPTADNFVGASGTSTSAGQYFSVGRGWNASTRRNLFSITSEGNIAIKKNIHSSTETKNQEGELYIFPARTLRSDSNADFSLISSNLIRRCPSSSPTAVCTYHFKYDTAGNHLGYSAIALANKEIDYGNGSTGEVAFYAGAPGSSLTSPLDWNSHVINAERTITRAQLNATKRFSVQHWGSSFHGNPVSGVGGCAGVMNWSAGSFTCSDQKLKKDIQNIEDESFMQILKLKPVSYFWNDHPFNKIMKMDQNKKLQYGFIAQDVERIFPSIVDEGQVKDSEGKVQKAKTISYISLIPHVVGVVQKIWHKVEALFEKVAIQDNKVKSLESKIEQLELQNQIIIDELCQAKSDSKICRNRVLENK
jgi:prepilin-type N-terminal cleavage/methylation domain-containing protein